MNRNAEHISDRAKELNVNLRPHVKTHRCLEIAKLQTENNFGGIMVSTLSEAKFFQQNGFWILFMAFRLSAGNLTKRLRLPKQFEKFSLLTDDAGNGWIIK